MTQPNPEPCDHLILRTVDANLNRSAEALRVIEDGLRFVLSDPHLTNRCKTLRHQIADWAKCFPVHDLMAVRHASGDVGRQDKVDSEYTRSGLDSIFRANFSRAGQSTRVLEEFAKTIDSQLAKSVELIRYQIYELEKATFVLLNSSQRLENTRIYVLVDSCGGLNDFGQRVDQLVAAGVDAIQFREKTLDDRQQFEYASILVNATRASRVLSIINDRVDIAIASGADGVHLGQDDLPIETARRLAGPKLMIGLSTHNLQQARDAVDAGANYLGVGPIFPSSTKQFSEFMGTELLREVAGEIALPSFAIGGIGLDNLNEVAQAGFQRVAISAAVADASVDLPELVERLKSTLGADRVSPPAAWQGI